jgi:hypothetical protein
MMPLESKVTEAVRIWVIEGKEHKKLEVVINKVDWEIKIKAVCLMKYIYIFFLKVIFSKIKFLKSELFSDSG